MPICAPNAVCSKIDLYETPWIERQCRCPATVTAAMPEIIIHHHHHHHHHEHRHHHQQQSPTEHTQHSNKINHQNKHILLDAASAAAAAAAHMNDKKFESYHLKKLMHKLGAVYEDDIHLPPPPTDNVNVNDYNTLLAEDAENSALPLDAAELNAPDSELSLLLKKKQQHNILYGTNEMGTRHSTGRIAAEKMSFIGGCPSGLGIEDGHTIADKTRHYKLCQPVHRLPVCR